MIQFSLLILVENVLFKAASKEKYLLHMKKKVILVERWRVLGLTH